MTNYSNWNINYLCRSHCIKSWFFSFNLCFSAFNLSTSFRHSSNSTPCWRWDIFSSNKLLSSEVVCCVFWKKQFRIIMLKFHHSISWRDSYGWLDGVIGMRDVLEIKGMNNYGVQKIKNCSRLYSLSDRGWQVRLLCIQSLCIEFHPYIIPTRNAMALTLE